MPYPLVAIDVAVLGVLADRRDWVERLLPAGGGLIRIMMDYRSLTLLMLRLAGVLMLVDGVSAIPRAFVNLHIAGGGQRDMESLLLSIVAAGVPGLTGMLLVYFPGTVGNRILASDQHSTFDVSQLQAIAFSVLGLYFVSTALFDGFYWLAKLRIYYMVVDQLNYGRPIPPRDQDFAGVASTCFQFCFGVTLLFGGRGLSNLVRRIRKH